MYACFFFIFISFSSLVLLNKIRVIIIILIVLGRKKNIYILKYIYLYREIKRDDLS